ncbi:hypothetical protein ACI8B_210004 [Acinetobacter proteolyticus]|uniref:Uncharacterized protein n=1 Tax=Acinetobacter proteolyticus TaxID=1776741 RepID=A0A653K2Z9_9GAMM|nr:hypothetical protein [Acinetobacter proteolyticus]VXA55201.1 hypothetical protein ACI8B_210004 [Acinetobacter proteolyticus]
MPIVVTLVAIGMRLYNRNRPLNYKQYIVVYVGYVFLIGINSIMPLDTKIIAFLLAALILAFGCLVDKKLKIS